MQRRALGVVLDEHADGLMSLPGVVGVMQGERKGKPCIKVLVTQRTSGVLQRIPQSIEGYPVVIKETGEIRAIGTER